MHVSRRQPRVSAVPAEGWLSDGRRVLHFRPVIWERCRQELEITSGEWLSGQAAPLLKRRERLSREQASRLWRQKRQAGWKSCAQQWTPPSFMGLD